MPSATTLASRVAHVRGLAGIPARHLDRLAGLTPGHTSAIERSKKIDVGAATLSGIASALGVSIDWIVRGSGKVPTARAVKAAVAVATERSNAA